MPSYEFLSGVASGIFVQQLFSKLWASGFALTFKNRSVALRVSKCEDPESPDVLIIKQED